MGDDYGIAIGLFKACLLTCGHFLDIRPRSFCLPHDTFLNPVTLTLQTQHPLSAHARLKRDEHFQTELVPLGSH